LAIFIVELVFGLRHKLNTHCCACSWVDVI